MLPTGYPLALILTLVVEVPLYALALRVGWQIRLATGVFLGVAVNLVTHPVLWFGLGTARHRAGYPLIALAAEVGVCAVEWALLRLALQRFARDTDAALLAVVCVGVNAASVLAGLIGALLESA